MTLFLDSEPSHTISYQMPAKSDDIWKLAKEWLKSKKNNKTYTMVKFIEGGTTFLFRTFDKTQSVWSYSGLNLAWMGFNYWF